jgi:hypothetical protein
VLAVGLDGDSEPPIVVGGASGPCDCSFSGVYSCFGGNAISVSQGSSVQLWDCDCDPSGITGVAVDITMGGRVIVMKIGPDMLGAAGAYDNGGGAVLAWPADGTTITGGAQIIDAPALSLSAVLAVGADADDKEITSLGAATAEDSACQLAQARSLAKSGGADPVTAAGLLADGWAWENQDTAKLTDGECGVILQCPAEAATSVHQLVLAVPEGDHQLTIQMSYCGDSNTYRHMGIGYKEGLGSDKKLEMLKLDTRAYGTFYKFDHADENTLSASTSLQAIIGMGAYMRIARVGNTIYYYRSLDGNAWFLLTSFATSAGYLGANGYNYLVIGVSEDVVAAVFSASITRLEIEDLGAI